MNINSLGNSENINPVRGIKHTNSSRPSSDADVAAGSDHLSAQFSDKIRRTLDAMPDVRPEVVERGRQLLADPSYPSQEIVNKIARLITPFAEA